MRRIGAMADAFGRGPLRGIDRGFKPEKRAAGTGGVRANAMREIGCAGYISGERGIEANPGIRRAAPGLPC